MKHGDPVKEANRQVPQIAITPDDLALIPDIINDYDMIRKGANNDSVVYSIRYGDLIEYMEVVQPRKGVLMLKINVEETYRRCQC